MSVSHNHLRQSAAHRNQTGVVEVYTRELVALLLERDYLRSALAAAARELSCQPDAAAAAQAALRGTA